MLFERSAYGILLLWNIQRNLGGQVPRQLANVAWWFATIQYLDETGAQINLNDTMQHVVIDSLTSLKSQLWRRVGPSCRRLRLHFKVESMRCSRSGLIFEVTVMFFLHSLLLRMYCFLARVVLSFSRLELQNMAWEMSSEIWDSWFMIHFIWFKGLGQTSAEKPVALWGAEQMVEHGRISIVNQEQQKLRAATLHERYSTQQFHKLWACYRVWNISAALQRTLVAHCFACLCWIYTLRDSTLHSPLANDVQTHRLQKLCRYAAEIDPIDDLAIPTEASTGPLLQTRAGDLQPSWGDCAGSSDLCIDGWLFGSESLWLT